VNNAGHRCIITHVNDRSCVTSFRRDANVNDMNWLMVARSGIDFFISKTIQLRCDSRESTVSVAGRFGMKFTSPFLAFLIFAADGGASGLLNFDLLPPLICTSSHPSLRILLRKLPILNAITCAHLYCDAMSVVNPINQLIHTHLSDTVQKSHESVTVFQVSFGTLGNAMVTCVMK